MKREKSSKVLGTAGAAAQAAGRAGSSGKGREGGRRTEGQPGGKARLRGSD